MLPWRRDGRGIVCKGGSEGEDLGRYRIRMTFLELKVGFRGNLIGEGEGADLRFIFFETLSFALNFKSDGVKNLCG